MKYWIFGLALLLSPALSWAHNPLSARYHLEINDQANVLTIQLAQAGVQQALLTTYGEEAIQDLYPHQLKELIVAYVKEHLSLATDQEPIELKQGGIKLGSHQTDLKFVLPPLAGEGKVFQVHIPAFEENAHHQTIFSYRMGEHSDRVILDSSNGYRATLPIGPQPATNHWFWTLLGSLLAMGSIGLLFLVRRQPTGK